MDWRLSLTTLPPPVKQTPVSFTVGLFRRRIEFPLGFGVKELRK
jgi:hypothetical protein